MASSSSRMWNPANPEGQFSEQLARHQVTWPRQARQGVEEGASLRSSADRPLAPRSLGDHKDRRRLLHANSPCDAAPRRSPRSTPADQRARRASCKAVAEPRRRRDRSCSRFPPARFYTLRTTSQTLTAPVASRRLEQEREGPEAERHGSTEGRPASVERGRQRGGTWEHFLVVFVRSCASRRRSPSPPRFDSQSKRYLRRPSPIAGHRARRIAGQRDRLDSGKSLDIGRRTTQRVPPANPRPARLAARVVRRFPRR